MIVPVLLFVLGLLLLIKGGDWFVDGATGIAHKFHLPEILIGATVVSIGTTLPEVMVSATSALEGKGSFAYGNAIGSIICNTALIAALTIAIRPAKADKSTLRLPVLFFFIAAAFYAVISYTTGFFARWVGIVFLCLFVLYMVLTVLSMKKHPDAADDEPEEEEGEARGLAKLFAPVKKFLYRNETVGNVVFLVIGAVLIAVGARLLVDNGTLLAAALGVPETVIGLTFVALGTSLPELVTAITALAKGHSALSLGNIVGANIFNIVLVCGASITLAPFAVPADKPPLFGYNPSLLVEIPLMLAVMAILTIPALIRGKLSRAQGIALLALYTGFLVFQFVI